MKAVIQNRYGPPDAVLQLREIDKPVIGDEDVLVLKPENISFEQAAAVPTSGYIALQNLQNAGEIRPRQRVLVNGGGWRDPLTEFLETKLSSP